MNKTETKRHKEKEIVSLMINLYCAKNHKTKNTLCPDCQQLKDYADMRTDKCPFMDTKTFCSNCNVHCYKSDMREKMKAVMKFTGPRMIFHHPVLAIKHLIETKKEKGNLYK